MGVALAKDEALTRDGALSEHVDIVQNSRAGDRFHYVWAAIQSLQLLSEQTGLREVWVERAAGAPVRGHEIIDIAQYYGNRPGVVTEVVVRQLKYSPVRADESLGLAAVGKALRNFAEIDRRRSVALSPPPGAKVRYEIVTNRPISSTLETSRKKVVERLTPVANSFHEKFLLWLDVDLETAAELCQRIAFVSDPTRLDALRTQLDIDTANLAAGAEPGAAAQLVEAVARRASGELKTPIRAENVAHVFGATLHDLTPAPSLLDRRTATVPRGCYDDLADAVLASTQPIVIAADGGAGKSTFAAQLPEQLSERAEVVVYDCFGNGSYRTPGRPRHRHRDGLVQITSELAALGLCEVLVPRSSIEPAEYMKAFEARLVEASIRLQRQSPGRQLVLLIDAADNAVMAAEAKPGETDFVQDILRMKVVPNVHIALTSRPHRVQLLRPPPGVVTHRFPGFSSTESASMLRAAYPEATDAESLEFHLRTSGNPRIQALAIADAEDLPGCLASLAGVADRRGDPLELLLQDRVEKILDAAGSERGALQRLSQLLATLRPRVPVAVLTALTGLDSSAITSFVSDLRRGLIVDEDAVQFLDEPTETYFREQYSLKDENAALLADQLATLAESSVYAAASLPQVMWETEQYERLMALALSGAALPATTEIERQQVASLRVEFALRAAIRLGQPSAIVSLAMLAGSLAASDERRRVILRNAADLTGDLFDGAAIDDLRATRAFPTVWPGDVYGAEALMLAVDPNRGGEARNRLRAAMAAIDAHVEALDAGRAARLEPRHVADIVLAIMYLAGPEQGANYLQKWRPRWILNTVSRVVSILLSRGDDLLAQELGKLSRSASLCVGVAAEQQRIGVAMSDEQAQVAWDVLRGESVDFDLDRTSDGAAIDASLRGIAWIAAAAVRLGRAASTDAVELLNKYLPTTPPYGLGDPHTRDNAGLLHAYALRARLRAVELTPADLLPPPDDRRSDQSAREAAERNLRPVLPWFDEWARWSTAGASDTAILDLLENYPTERFSYQDPALLRRLVSPIAAQLARSSHDLAVVARFNDIVGMAPEHSGFYLAVDMIQCLHGDERFSDAVLRCLNAAASSARSYKQSSEQTAEDFIDLARAAYPYEKQEALEYYGEALSIVERVGQDVGDQWDATVAVANSAGLADEQDAYRLAAQLGSVGEALAPYRDGIDDAALIRAIHHLSGSRALALVSQWRDRRHSYFDYLVASLAEDKAGIFENAPHYGIAFSALSDRISVSDLLAKVQRAGMLDERRFNLIRLLEHTRGAELDGDRVGHDLAQRYSIPPLVDPMPKTPTGFDSEDDEFAKGRERHERLLQIGLAALDLSTAEGMQQASLALSELSLGSAVGPLVDAMAQSASSKWGRTVEQFGRNASFSRWQQAQFLGAASKLSTPSRAFSAALKHLALEYLRGNATEVVTGRGYRVELAQLSSIIGISSRDVLLDALAHADPAVIASSTDHCYRIAKTLAGLMTEDEANQTLRAALGSMSRALDLPAWDALSVSIPSTGDLPSATAAFLWSALGDPKSETRWRAIHAVRFLMEFDDEAFAEALVQLVIEGRPTSYNDPRFPFYDMHAVEGFLVAAERVAVSSDRLIRRFLPAITHLQEAYPDHLRIQANCWQIATRVGDESLAERSLLPASPPQVVDDADLPRAPKPWQKDAPRSEFRFNFDTDEYWLGRLTASFHVDHAEVLKSASDLILDSWAWRGREELENDPRRIADVYDEGETSFYKSEFPKSDDLRYYLTYHAALTVAGQLARTKPSLKADGESHSELAQWFAYFDLARADRRWVSDARRPVPHRLGHVPIDSSSKSDWRWRLGADDFVRAFLDGSEWATVRQFARNSDYGGRETISISSALVDPESASALARALQTARSLQNLRLPLVDRHEDESRPAMGPFALRGWIEDESGEQGVDRRDPFASRISFPTPRPAGWVIDCLSLDETLDGVGWATPNADQPAFVAETWAQEDGGREPRGPVGDRLRVRSGFLDEIVKATGGTLVLEVRIDRMPERRTFRSDDDQPEYLDDYVRYFTFTPAGWRDYLGHVVAGGTPR